MSIITDNSPETLFQRVMQLGGNELDRFVERVLLFQAQRHQTPLQPMDNIPLRFRADLQLLHSLTDQTLIRIIGTDLDVSKQQLYASLLEENSRRSLAPSEQIQLTMLREEADLLMFRRAYAALLLKQRGQSVPNTSHS